MTEQAAGLPAIQRTGSKLGWISLAFGVVNVLLTFLSLDWAGSAVSADYQYVVWLTWLALVVLLWLAGVTMAIIALVRKGPAVWVPILSLLLHAAIVCRGLTVILSLLP